MSNADSGISLIYMLTSGSAALKVSILVIRFNFHVQIVIHLRDYIHRRKRRMSPSGRIKGECRTNRCTPRSPFR